MLLIPDKIFDKLDDITVQVLETEGIRGLILDIDYTLAPKHSPLPDESVIKLIEELKILNIKLYLISNNHKNRVSIFAQALRLPYIYSGLKPFPRSFLRAVREMGLPKGEVACVGDQIYTDVLGAHLSGLRAWLLPEKSSRVSLPYRIRSTFEKPFIRSYYKKEGR